MDETRTVIRQWVSRRAHAVQRRFEAAVRPVFVVERDVPVQVATCVLLMVEKLLFILSAAHVLDERERGLYVFGPHGLVALTGEFITSTPPAIGGRKADKADVGVVQLSSTAQSSLAGAGSLTPSDLALDDRVASASGPWHYLVLGYPSTRFKTFVREKRLKGEGFILTARPAPHDVYQELGVADFSHVVLMFDRQDVTNISGRVTAPKLSGVSGGGVWALGPVDDEQARDAKLAAIAVEWAPARPKAIVGTRIALFTEVLRQHYPALAESVPAPNDLRVTLNSRAV